MRHTAYCSGEISFSHPSSVFTTFFSMKRTPVKDYGILIPALQTQSQVDGSGACRSAHYKETPQLLLSDRELQRRHEQSGRGQWHRRTSHKVPMCRTVSGRM